MKNAFLLILIFALATDKVGAEPIFTNVISDGADRHYVALVEKEPKKLHIIRVEGDGHTVEATVDILIGSSSGKKEVEGDKKTPNGVYYLVGFMNGKTLIKRYGDYAKIYGMGAYPTNYPNPLDRALGRTGHGIWIHGLNPEKHKDATEGCVAMENADMIRIQDRLYVGLPVIITEKADTAALDKYKNIRANELARITNFIDAWAVGEYDLFKEFIHPKYRSYSNANAKKYLSGKSQLMKLFPKKEIAISNIKAYLQEYESVVYDLEQFYCAPNITTYSRKKYYFADYQGDMKLISEEIIPMNPAPYIEKAVFEFVEKWRMAWQSGNIENYATFYANPANSWLENKRNLFATSGNIDVNISDISWKTGRQNTIIVNFFQNYFSDITKDSGIKTLTIKGCPSGYKIVSEVWLAK